ncbi:hypothetical protein PRIPAC_85560 [Pristionchus pacificus]|nr:hypothetical protein PRIPAC_85560 [Pristionchus pacificus]
MTLIQNLFSMAQRGSEEVSDDFRNSISSVRRSEATEFTKILIDRISVLENKLESRAVDIDNLKENRFELLNQLCEMERENKSKSEKIEKYKVEVEENSHILSKNEATIRSLKNDLEKKDKEVNKYKNEVGVNSKLLAMNEDTIELLENELNELKLEIVHYRMAKVELESTKLSLQAMIKANDIKIAEQEKWNSSLVKNNENLLLSFATLAEMKKENGEFVSNTMRLLHALNDNNQISDTTIRAQFSGISNLSGSYVYSHPITFAGIEWRIGVKKSEGHLELSLVGEKNDDDKWSCSVFSEFQLISHKSMEIIHRRGRHGSADVYDKDARSWGYVKFISFEDLFDDQKGFVKEDSINVAVQIKAFPLKKSSNFSLHVEPAHFVWDELF